MEEFFGIGPVLCPNPGDAALADTAWRCRQGWSLTPSDGQPCGGGKDGGTPVSSTVNIKKKVQYLYTPSVKQWLARANSREWMM